MAGRTTVEPPLIGWVFALNDGTMVRSWSFRSPAPWLTRSAAASTSTGTADSVALRGWAREPTTTVSSVNPASSRCISAGDSPRASISAGVIPSARPSSPAGASVGSSPSSRGSSFCGVTDADDAHGTASTTNARTVTTSGPSIRFTLTPWRRGDADPTGMPPASAFLGDVDTRMTRTGQRNHEDVDPARARGGSGVRL